MLTLARNLLACFSSIRNWRAYTWIFDVAPNPGFPLRAWAESISWARAREFCANEVEYELYVFIPELGGLLTKFCCTTIRQCH